MRDGGLGIQGRSRLQRNVATTDAGAAEREKPVWKTCFVQQPGPVVDIFRAPLGAIRSTTTFNAATAPPMTPETKTGVPVASTRGRRAIAPLSGGGTSASSSRPRGGGTIFAGREGTPALQAIRDTDDRWIQARRIWNQHAYHVTNVREDGTIPVVEPKSWTLLNTFRTNAQIQAGGVCEPAG